MRCLTCGDRQTDTTNMVWFTGVASINIKGLMWHKVNWSACSLECARDAAEKAAIMCAGDKDD